MTCSLICIFVGGEYDPHATRTRGFFGVEGAFSLSRGNLYGSAAVTGAAIPLIENN